MHAMMIIFLFVFSLFGVVVLIRWLSGSLAPSASYDDEEDDVVANVSAMSQTMMNSNYGYPNPYAAMPQVVVVQDDPVFDTMAAGILADIAVTAAVDVADTVETAVVDTVDAPATPVYVELAPSYDAPQDYSDSGSSSNNC